MTRTLLYVGAALCVAAASCAPPVRCGEGTVLVNGVCAVDRDGVVADQQREDAPSRDGSPFDASVEDVSPTDVVSVEDVAPDVSGAFDAADVPVIDTGVATDSGLSVDTGIADTGIADTGIADAGPLVLLADDTLLFRSATAQMLPGHALCPTLTILRSDGSRVSVLPGSAMVTIVPNDPAVLEVARPGECGALGGVIGLSPRATTARFTVQSMGMSVSAVLGVTVLDGRVQFETSDSAVVPLGGEVEYQTLRRHELTGGGSASVSSDVFLVRRFFEGLRSEPAGLLSVGDINTTNGRMNLRGLALGSGRIVGGYGPPGRVTPFVAMGTVTVVTPGTITSVGPLFYFRDGTFVSQGAPSTMTVGDCLEARISAQFSSGMLTYRQFITSGATLTASGDGRIDSGPPTRVCATARGELSVRACAGTICTTETIPVLAAGQPLPTLTLSPTSVTFVQRFLGAFDGCVPLRATLRYSDGMMRDVTNSLATRWFAPWIPPAPPVIFFRTMTGEVPRVDAMGNPCFNASGPAMRTYDFNVDVTYGSSTASPRLSVAVR